MVKIIYNKLLRGWFVVRGPHQTPLTGRFDTKADATAWLHRNDRAERERRMVADYISEGLGE